MSELDEKLSVILDQYSDDEHSDAVLNDLLGDVNLQYKLRRYQMIGDVMRHELPDQINLDLSYQIMSQVRQIEPDQSPVATDRAKTAGQGITLSWAMLKPFTGIAVAASVAIVSISLWQTTSVNPQPGSDGNQLVSAEQQKIEKLASQPIQGDAVTVSSSLGGTRWNVKQDTPALQQKLNAYLVNHTEYSVPMQGLIPQARVAGFDAEQ